MQQHESNAHEPALLAGSEDGGMPSSVVGKMHSPSYLFFFVHSWFLLRFVTNELLWSIYMRIPLLPMP